MLFTVEMKRRRGMYVFILLCWHTAYELLAAEMIERRKRIGLAM
jgi:hypothetical protein